MGVAHHEVRVGLVLRQPVAVERARMQQEHVGRPERHGVHLPLLVLDRVVRLPVHIDDAEFDSEVAGPDYGAGATVVLALGPRGR